MTKIRRNDPCSCGSGKKFKRCCLPQLEANRGQNAKKARLDSQKIKTAHPKDIVRQIQQNHEELIEITDRSNEIIDLIHENQLDKAELHAKKLNEDFPDDHDGHELLAWVYEEKKDKIQAAKHYKLAIEMAEKNSTQEDNEHLKRLKQRAANLNSSINL